MYKTENPKRKQLSDFLQDIDEEIISFERGTEVDTANSMIYMKW